MKKNKPHTPIIQPITNRDTENDVNAAIPHEEYSSQTNSNTSLKLGNISILPPGHSRIQTKTNMGNSGDKFEQEANQVADYLSNEEPAYSQTSTSISNPIYNGGGGTINKSTLSPNSGKGKPLPADVQNSFEQKIPFDFSSVRIHNNSQSEISTKKLGAKAYTSGNNIFFGKNEYNPHTPEGKHLLAHELTHVIQQSQSTDAPNIQKQDESYDFQYEADRLTSFELQQEIASMRDQIEFEDACYEDESYLFERLQVFEQTLAQRQEHLLMFQEGVGDIREMYRQMYGIRDPFFAAQHQMDNNTNEALFVMGFGMGILSEIPPGELKDVQKEMENNQVDFTLGYLVGLPIGLWHGLSGMVVGLWDMAKFLSKFTPGGMLDMIWEDAMEYYADPQAYIEKRRAQYEQVVAIVEALQEFGREFEEDPTIVMQYSADLGVAVGQEFTNYITNDFFRISTYEKGKLVGDIAGMILFEILMEIILAIATEGIGNIIRGVGAVGQGARATGRLAQLFRKMLSSSKALQKLFKAVTGLEDIADVTRTIERSVDIAEDLTPPAPKPRKVTPDMPDTPSHGVSDVAPGSDIPETEVVRRRKPGQSNPDSSASPQQHVDAAPEVPERFPDLEEGMQSEISRGVVDENPDNLPVREGLPGSDEPEVIRRGRPSQEQTPNTSSSSSQPDKKPTPETPERIPEVEEVIESEDTRIITRGDGDKPGVIIRRRRGKKPGKKRKSSTPEPELEPTPESSERFPDLHEELEVDRNQGVVDRGEDVVGEDMRGRVSESTSARSSSSTFHDRVRQTPREGQRGTWRSLDDGPAVRGESMFIPEDPKVARILESRGVDGIVYKNGYPDFTPVSDREIPIRITADRDDNFRRVYEWLADDMQITPAQAKQHIIDNNWTIHELEGRDAVQFIDRDVHAFFGHYGGVGEEKALHGIVTAGGKTY